MRRIDFRGQRLDTKEWTYGCLLITELKGNLEPLHYFICPIKNEGMHRVMPETVGQFTGLHDKNGKEIYEGDIVEYEDYSNGLYLFKEQPKAKGVIKINDLLSEIYLKGLGTFEGNKVEVIGNIYENPELLEVSHG